MGHWREARASSPTRRLACRSGLAAGGIVPFNTGSGLGLSCQCRSLMPARNRRDRAGTVPDWGHKPVWPPGHCESTCELPLRGARAAPRLHRGLGSGHGMTAGRRAVRPAPRGAHGTVRATAGRARAAGRSWRSRAFADQRPRVRKRGPRARHLRRRTGLRHCSSGSPLRRMEDGCRCSQCSVTLRAGGSDRISRGSAARRGDQCVQMARMRRQCGTRARCAVGHTAVRLWTGWAWWTEALRKCVRVCACVCVCVRVCVCAWEEATPEPAGRERP